MAYIQRQKHTMSYKWVVWEKGEGEEYKKVKKKKKKAQKKK